MAIDRKALRHALRDALRARMTADGDPREFLTRSINPSNIAGRCPLLVIEAADEDPEFEDPNLPPIWRISVDVAIYVHPDARDPDPDAILDDLLGHLEVALEHRDGERPGWWTTLGNKCVRACPGGQAQRYVQGDTYWAVQPVEIVVTRSKPGLP